SKGMQQKLQFITTVFHKPEIIILDELFSGLDPLNIELVKNTLFELRDQGATILFSTHVMEQAEKMCDYIALVKDGEKILDGRMSEVKAQFGKNSVQIVFDGDPSLIRGHAAVAKVLEFPNYLEAKLKDGADHMALLKDISASARISRFELVEPSLYNIFIEVARITPGEAESEQMRQEAANV
ncbi:MAG: ABC transporter ATP-binding protein, partial [Candidatus Zixiibacteriota bacterium]